MLNQNLERKDNLLTLFGSASGNYLVVVSLYRNDTFGPYFDQRAMGYSNLAHYWYLKKEIGSLDAFVKFWLPSRFFLLNRETREFILSRIRNFAGGHKMGLIESNE